MKLLSIILLLVVLNSCGTTTEKQTVEQADSTKIDSMKTDSIASTPVVVNDTFKLITLSKTIPGDIDSNTVQKLPENLKAITALYAAMGGSGCDGEHCKLTSALGLGKQGSNAHEQIITKYFTNDKAAAMAIQQDCYLPPNTASSFSDYQYLNLINLGDTIKVDYNLMVYSHGKTQYIKGPDVYVFKNNQFQKIKRNIWAFAEK